MTRLGDDHMQPAQQSNLGGNENIGSAASHIGRDGNRAMLPSQRDYSRFVIVLSSVENADRQAATLQVISKLF